MGEFQKDFLQHNFLVHFKVIQTLEQRLVHPKDRTPKLNLSCVMAGVHCSEEWKLIVQH